MASIELINEAQRIRDLGRRKNGLRVVQDAGSTRPFRNPLKAKPSEPSDHVCIIGDYGKEKIVIEAMPSITDARNNNKLQSTFHSYEECT